jgi:hypothetical protein
VGVSPWQALLAVAGGVVALVGVMVSWMTFLILRESKNTEVMVRRFEYEDRAEAEWAEAIRVVVEQLEGQDDGV